MATVFVVNFAGHDYTQAEKWGPVRPMTMGFVSFESLDRLVFQFAGEIEKTSKDDWLLLSGAGVLNVIAAVIWFWKHKKINILVHDGQTDGYRELKITPRQLAKIFQELIIGKEG